MASRFYNPPRGPEWFFFWISITITGWLGALLLSGAIYNWLKSFLPAGASWIIGGVTGGALLGFIQYLFLGPEIKGIRLWLLTSGSGWILGLIVTTLIIRAINSITGVAISSVAGGLVFGLVQCIGLGPGIAQRLRWTIVTSLTWLGLLTLSTVIPEKNEIFFIIGGTPVEVALHWITSGAIVIPIALFAQIILFPQKDRFFPLN